MLVFPFTTAVVLVLVLALSVSSLISVCGYTQSELNTEIFVDDEAEIAQFTSTSRTPGTREHSQWGYLLAASNAADALSGWTTNVLPKWEKHLATLRDSAQAAPADETTEERALRIAAYQELKFSYLAPVVSSADLTELISLDGTYGRRLANLRAAPNSRFNPHRLVIDDVDPEKLVDSTDLHRLYRCDTLQLAAAKGYGALIHMVWDMMEMPDMPGYEEHPHDDWMWTYTWSPHCKMTSVVQMSSLTPLHLLTMFSNKGNLERLRTANFLLEKYSHLVDLSIITPPVEAVNATMAAEEEDSEEKRLRELIQNHPDLAKYIPGPHVDDEERARLRMHHDRKAAQIIEAEKEKIKEENKKNQTKQKKVKKVKKDTLWDRFYANNVVYSPAEPGHDTPLAMAADRGLTDLFDLYLLHAVPPHYEDVDQWPTYQKMGIHPFLLDLAQERELILIPRAKQEKRMEWETKQKEAAEARKNVPKSAKTVVDASVREGIRQDITEEDIARAVDGAAAEAELARVELEETMPEIDEDDLVLKERPAKDKNGKPLKGGTARAALPHLLYPDGTRTPLPLYSNARDQAEYYNSSTGDSLYVPRHFARFRQELHRAFHYAVMNGSMEIVRSLVERRDVLRLNVNVRSHGGRGDTAVHGACMTGNTHMLMYLLDNGGDSSMLTTNEKWSLGEVCEHHNAAATAQTYFAWKRKWMERTLKDATSHSTGEALAIADAVEADKDVIRIREEDRAAKEKKRPAPASWARTNNGENVPPRTEEVLVNMN